MNRPGCWSLPPMADVQVETLRPTSSGFMSTFSARSVVTYFVARSRVPVATIHGHLSCLLVIYVMLADSSIAFLRV